MSTCVAVVTCRFVADQFGRLHLSHAAKEAAQLVLTHALRQVVHDQVGPRVVVLLHHCFGEAVIVQLLIPPQVRNSQVSITNSQYKGSLKTKHPIKKQHYLCSCSFGGSVSAFTLRRLDLTHLNTHKHTQGLVLSGSGSGS